MSCSPPHISTTGLLLLLLQLLSTPSAALINPRLCRERNKVLYLLYHLEKLHIEDFISSAFGQFPFNFRQNGLIFIRYNFSSFHSHSVFSGRLSVENVDQHVELSTDQGSRPSFAEVSKLLRLRFRCRRVDAPAPTGHFEEIE